jgi:hypothetical protein
MYISHKEELSLDAQLKKYAIRSFREFISTTSFKNVDMFKRGTDYVWILQK